MIRHPLIGRPLLVGGLLTMMAIGFDGSASEAMPMGHGDSLASPDETWGAERDGLAASLSASQARVVGDAPIVVRYRVRNVSTKDQVVWHAGFWPNHKIEVTDATGAEVPLTEQGKLRRNAFDPDGPRRKNVPVTLAPGQIDEPQPALDLRDLVRFPKPGVYHARCLYQQGPVTLWSNVLDIHLDAP